MRASLRKPLAVAGAAALALFGAATVLAFRAARHVEDQLAPHKLTGPALVPPPGEEAISFRTTDGLTLHGWLHRGEGPALIVLAHGYSQSRVERLVEAQPLAAKGFSTLVFDLRAHGESDGELSTMGDKESLDVEAAIEAGLTATHAAKLGLFGFSVGATAAEDTASRDSRVDAVVLVAPDPTVEAGIRSDFSRWGLISELPALMAVRHHGIDLAAGHWAANLPGLARRGLLLIAGDHEPDMPLNLTMLAEAKAAGAETMLVAGATHGGYARAAPDLYPARVVDFFEHRLGTQRRDGN